MLSNIDTGARKLVNTILDFLVLPSKDLDLPSIDRRSSLMFLKKR